MGFDNNKLNQAKQAKNLKHIIHKIYLFKNWGVGGGGGQCLNKIASKSSTYVSKRSHAKNQEARPSGRGFRVCLGTLRL